MREDSDRMVIPLEVRGSSVSRILECSYRYAYERKNPVGFVSSGEDVALVFGNMVHGQITGHEYTVPRLIRYDDRTKTRRDLDRQVRQAVRDLGRVVGDLNVSDSEVHLESKVRYKRLWGDMLLSVSGTIDLLCWGADGRHDVVDLKTGWGHLEKSFTQLSVYCCLLYTSPSPRDS